MKRQALYRIEWQDDGTAPRPPAVVPIRASGPWPTDTDAELLYDGPMGRTVITVTTEPATKEDDESRTG